MADLLDRQLSKYGGSFSVDDLLLTFPNIAGQAAFLPFIISQISLNYGQQIGRFYGMNLNKVFLVSGRPQGNGTMQQILAPQANLGDFYRVYGNVCNADRNVLQFSLRNGCGDQQSSVQRFLASLCVVSQTSISGTSDQGVVSNNAQFTYEGLEYSTN